MASGILLNPPPLIIPTVFTFLLSNFNAMHLDSIVLSSSLAIS